MVWHDHGGVSRRISQRQSQSQWRWNGNFGIWQDEDVCQPQRVFHISTYRLNCSFDDSTTSKSHDPYSEIRHAIAELGTGLNLEYGFLLHPLSAPLAMAAAATTS